MSERWRPTPLIALSALLHALALPWLILRWSDYPWVLGVLVLDHLVLMACGLWPRSTWLGPNLLRLPDAAAARGEVAITIDDGPDPEVTPQVLAILARHGAKATFFCIGERATAHPELCRAMVAAGHRVENHGQRHRNTLAFSGLGGWRREVGEAQQTLQAITGQAPRYYRALAGLRNPLLDPVLHRLGLRLATWTARGFDTRCKQPDVVLARLLKDMEAGHILLLHDGNAARTHQGRAMILEVLPPLLDALQSRQLRAVTLCAACKLP